MRQPAEVQRRRVVVTGGAGFIGSHLCDALLLEGSTVVCVDNLVGTRGSTRNLTHALTNPRFTFVNEPLIDWAERADLGGIDCIFHLAASKHAVSLVDPERDLVVNGLATLRLLLRAAEHGVPKFVHASTGSVFGETTVHVESESRNPVSLYGISKLAGEQYCRVIDDIFGLDCTVLRYYNVIGPRQDSAEGGGVVPIFVRRCLEGRPLTIYGTGAQTRSFTSVRDIVRATTLAVVSEEMRHASFNCASGVQVSINELADFVLTELGGVREIEYAPGRPGDIVNFAVDNARLRQIGLEFETDWRAMVREVIASMEGDVASGVRYLGAGA